jgi:AcrR family transcriptional regulator
MAKSAHPGSKRRTRPGTPAQRRGETPVLRKRKRPPNNREELAAARRRAILDAALLEFAERGFDAARLDDVAARAGIAKGTLYLYFADKEELFEEVIRSAASPLLDRVGALTMAPDMPTPELLETLFALFEKEILGTKRKLLVRLIIAEGPRFPRIAGFYYRTVVAQAMPLVARIAKRAAERGEFATDAYARYPQLVVAPLLLAIIWDGLFSAIAPLDAAGLFEAHREAIIGKPRRASS